MFNPIILSKLWKTLKLRKKNGKSAKIQEPGKTLLKTNTFVGIIVPRGGPYMKIVPLKVYGEHR